MSAPVVARARIGLPMAAPLLLLSAALVAAGIWLWSTGEAEYGGAMLLGALVPVPVLLASRRIVRVTDQGLEVRSMLARRKVPWAQVTGLGAVASGAGLRLVVFVSSGPDVEFGDDWVGAAAVAASLQARAPAASAPFDRGAALADPPRGDLAAQIGAPAGLLDRLLDQATMVLKEQGVERVDRKRLQAFGPSQVYELFGILRRLAREPDVRWAELLRDHFRKVDALRAAATALAADPPPYEALSGKLRLQLYRDAAAEPLGEGFGLVVVLRDPNGEISVSPELIERWGVGRATVVQQARDNLLALKLPVQRDAGSGMVAWAGEYAASQCAVLDRRVELDPELGALVAFPGQEVLVAVPIADPSTLSSLLEGKFARFLTGVAGRTSSPLSGCVYWWHRGRITEIPVVPGKAGHHAVPPDLAARLAQRTW